MGQLLGMLRGAATASLKAGVSDTDLGRVEAIIRSMTPDERHNQRSSTEAVNGGSPPGREQPPRRERSTAAVCRGTEADEGLGRGEEPDTGTRRSRPEAYEEEVTPWR